MTVYQENAMKTCVDASYCFDVKTGLLSMEFDLEECTRNGFTEAIIMNEQGGETFGQYRDSSGKKLAGGEISCWDEVTADEAWFSDPNRGVTFWLRQAAGARLFRGREGIGSRLSWSGFGYSMSPGVGHFQCAVRIGKLP